MVDAEVTSRRRDALQAQRYRTCDESGGAKASLQGRCFYHCLLPILSDSVSFRRLQGTTARQRRYTANHNRRC
jgi:hypothetical protein